MDEDETLTDGVEFITLHARIIHELGKNPCMAQEALARRLNVTMRTVQRHLNDLEREGFVRVRRDRKPYTYEIAWKKPLTHFEPLTVAVFRPGVLEDLATRIDEDGLSLA